MYDVKSILNFVFIGKFSCTFNSDKVNIGGSFLSFTVKVTSVETVLLPESVTVMVNMTLLISSKFKDAPN